MKDEVEKLTIEETRLRTELCFLLSNQLVTDHEQVDTVRRQIEAIVRQKHELEQQLKESE